MFWQLADGSERPIRLYSSDYHQIPGAWSPDGATILFVDEDGDGADIFALAVDEPDRKPVPLLTEDFREEYPALSPDGRWLAYASNESGGHEVYVRAYPSLERKQQVSSDGGRMPAWSADGDELFYVAISPAQNGEDKMMSVPITGQPDLIPGTPRELFQGSFQVSWAIRTYDVAPDGRFLMVEQNQTSRTTDTVRIILNWFDELERLAPTED